MLHGKTLQGLIPALLTSEEKIDATIGLPQDHTPLGLLTTNLIRVNGAKESTDDTADPCTSPCTKPGLCGKNKLALQTSIVAHSSGACGGSEGGRFTGQVASHHRHLQAASQCQNETFQLLHSSMCQVFVV